MSDYNLEDELKKLLGSSEDTSQYAQQLMGTSPEQNIPTPLTAVEEQRKARVASFLGGRSEPELPDNTPIETIHQRSLLAPTITRKVPTQQIDINAINEPNNFAKAFPELQDLPELQKSSTDSLGLTSMPEAPEVQPEELSPSSHEAVVPISRIPSGFASKAAPAAPMSRQQEASKLVRSFIPNSEDQALKDAQDRAATIRSLSNYGEIGDQFAEAFSRGAYKANKDNYANLRKEGEQGVQDIKELRAAAMQETAAKTARLGLKKLEEKSDPNSNTSIQLREMYKKAMPAFAKQPGFELMTADDLEQARNIMEFRERADARVAEQKYKYDLLRADKELKGDAKKERMQQLSTEFYSKGKVAEDIKAVKHAEDTFDKWKGVYNSGGKLAPGKDGAFIMEVGKLLQGDNSVLRESDVRTLFGMSKKDELGVALKNVFVSSKLADKNRLALMELVKERSDDAANRLYAQHGNIHEANVDTFGRDEAVKMLSPVLRKGKWLEYGAGEEINKAPPTEAVQEIKPKSTDSEMVPVIAPNGKKGSVPKNKLNAAIKAGYRAQ